MYLKGISQLGGDHDEKNFLLFLLFSGIFMGKYDPEKEGEQLSLVYLVSLCVWVCFS